MWKFNIVYSDPFWSRSHISSVWISHDSSVIFRLELLSIEWNSMRVGGHGNMIISTSMNINLGHLGGASIFAKIHLWRHFIEMFFFQLLWRGILISLNLYLFLVIHNNFTMSCYPNSALSSVMIPLSPNSFGCLWIEKLLLVLCLNTPSYYGMVS